MDLQKIVWQITKKNVSDWFFEFADQPEWQRMRFARPKNNISVSTDLELTDFLYNLDKCLNQYTSEIYKVEITTNLIMN